MPLHHLHTNVHRESPHLFQNRLWPCRGRRPESDPASLKNNALTSPKPQTYIEKDPISPSKRLRAPRSAVACRLSPFSRNNAPTSPPYKRTQRKPPWYSKTDFARRATPAVSAVEVLGCHGGLYSNYPLYLGDVGHVSGTTSLRSPSCALRSV